MKNFDKAFGMEKIEEEIIYIKKTNSTVADIDPAMVRPYPGIFTHGIKINDPIVCHNFVEVGELWSIDFIGTLDPSLKDRHKCINEVTLDDLRIDPPKGLIQPRAAWFMWAGSRIRQGKRIFSGKTGKTKWLSKEQMDRVLFLSDIELEFERVRREVVPDAVSRLSCLWVAEDTEAGRNHIREMFSPSSDIFILKVQIPIARNVTKADTAWFNKYYENQNTDYIVQYWQSTSSGSGSPTWEFLVDGVIKVDDPDGIEYVRKNGKFPKK